MMLQADNNFKICVFFPKKVIKNHQVFGIKDFLFRETYAIILLYLYNQVNHNLIQMREVLFIR